MHRNLIFADDEIVFLRELRRRKVEFMVVGLSAAALQGAPVVTQDVDLWFKDLEDPRLLKALEAVDGILVPSMGLNPPMLAGEAVKLFDIVVHMHGLDSFDSEVRNAETIKVEGVGIKVLPLARIIRSKEILGREKDKIVMKVLKDALKIKETIAGKHKR